MVQNIVQFGDGVLFDRQKGGTFVVNASWFRSKSNNRTIELTFDTAQVCTLTPAPSLEFFLAPPILPRTSIQHEMLLRLAEVRTLSRLQPTAALVNYAWFKFDNFMQFNIRIPLPTASNISNANPAVTGKYKLTYCDEDLLIGRAQVGGGVFIFEKADASVLW